MAAVQKKDKRRRRQILTWRTQIMTESGGLLKAESYLPRIICWSRDSHFLRMFGHKSFKEVIKVNKVFRVCLLSIWLVSWKEEEIWTLRETADTKHVHMLRKDHGKTEESDVRKDQRNQVYQHLILDHQPPELWEEEKKNLLVKASTLWYLVMTSQAS